MSNPEQTPGVPEFMTAYLSWEAFTAAIVRLTSLEQLEGAPIISSNTGSGSHRVFVVTPGDREYLGRMGIDDNDGDETDLILIKQGVEIKLWHDFDPGAHAESYRLATEDLDAVEAVVLSATDAFRILQPELVDAKIKREGHTLVQTLRLLITYERPIPSILE